MKYEVWSLTESLSLSQKIKFCSSFSYRVHQNHSFSLLHRFRSVLVTCDRYLRSINHDLKTATLIERLFAVRNWILYCNFSLKIYFSFSLSFLDISPYHFAVQRWCCHWKRKNGAHLLSQRLCLYLILMA